MAHIVHRRRWLPVGFCWLTILLHQLHNLAAAQQQQQQQRRCYSCTTLDADRLLAEVQDPGWRKWLEQVRFVPRSRECADPFSTISALRHGVRSVACEDGLCLKLWFREANSEKAQFWRSCVPGGESLREDCTRIESSQGRLELCTCQGPLCNRAGTKRGPNVSLVGILLMIATTAALTFIGTSVNPLI